jgi:alcohol dehydrogenase class IV
VAESFSWLMPTRIVHGPGSVARIPELARELGLSRMLVVTDPGVRAAGHPDRVAALLRDAGLDVEWFAEVDQDGSVAAVERGCALYRHSRRDGVVAVGGGSCLVAAKGVALLATNGGRLQDYEGMRPVPRPAAPVLAVPTTAGTGSEVSQMVPAFDAERGHKLAVGHANCFPRAAVLDPELLATVPRRQAALTGIDGLSHAVEALFTKLRTPVTDVLALGAARLFARDLRRAVETGAADAWENCLLAAALANMACGNAKLGLAHVLAHPLSGLCRVPHAVAISVVLPHVMRFNLPAAPEGFRDLAAALGAGADPEAAPRAVERLVADLGLPRRLADAGVRPQDLEPMALRCAAGIYGALDERCTPETPVLSPNVRPARVADCLELYRQAL